MTIEWRLHPFAAPHLRPLTDATRTLPLSRKDAALLTYLAFAGSAPSVHIALLLWPGADTRRALNSLRQRLHRLRRATGARLLEVADTAMLATDLVVAAAGDDGAGVLLGACDYADAPDFASWLEAQRKTRADAHRDALAGAASAAEGAGELAGALLLAQRILADDALSEHAHRRVMRLHYRRGDIAAAVAAFETCERVLKDELGLQPSPETLQLLRTVERSSTTAMAHAPAVAPMPASLLRPPRAVGRASERSALHAAHASGHIAVVVGEAGMGKTRLLQDFVATQPRAAVHVQARPGDAAVPYGALARLLRAVVDAAPAALDAAARLALARIVPAFCGDAALPGAVSAARLQGAVEQLLARAATAGHATIVVDDLHFADRASVEMLRALVDADALVDVCWVFAHRPLAAAEEGGVLLQTLADAPRACWIMLSALSGADLVDLLDSLALPGVDAATLAPALAQHSGGNPLYVLETLRSVHADGAVVTTLPSPRSVAHLIDRRLQSLSDKALNLGRVAALAGPDFSAELAEHALATPVLLLANAWAELEAADVLCGNAFAHDLVRDGMLRATPQAIATHAHRLIAQHLVSRGADPARVAAHWLAAGAMDKAATAFRDAADRARLAARPHEQAQLLQACADALDAAGEPAAAVLAHVAAIDPLLQGQGAGAALALTDRLLARQLSPRLAAKVLSARALSLMWAGRVADAEAAARQSLTATDTDADDDATRVNALCMLALARGLRGDVQGAVAMLQPWEHRIDRIADSDVRASFLGNLTSLLLQADRYGQALPIARRHLALTRELRMAGEQVTALMNLSNLHGRRGDLDEAVEHAGAADALLADSGQSDSLLDWNRIVFGYWLCGAGRFTEGLTHLETAIDSLQRLATGGAMLLAMGRDLAAHIWLTLGQPARAHRLVDGQPVQPDGRLRARQLLLCWLVARALGKRDAVPLAELRRMVAVSDPNRLGAEIEAAAVDPDAATAADRLLALQSLAEQHEHLPLAVQAASLRIDAFVRGGRLAALPASILDVERAALVSRAPNVYLPALLERCAAGWRAIDRTADADRCIDAALHWVHAVALPNVAVPWIDGFLLRNPVNARLRAAAAARHRQP